MIKPILIYIFLAISMLWGCNNPKKTDNKESLQTNLKETKKDTLTDTVAIRNTEIPDSAFIVMNDYSKDFAYDMKYATDDNFLNKTVYPCGNCVIRKEVADALIKANEELNQRGLKIKFYDCYRPLSVQKQMWEIYPDARYVANPNSSGSIHNRGGAVDITLVTLDGVELNMGTGFDHFGVEAHHSYTSLPDTVISNRNVLKETMIANEFKPISSEWWHYNFDNAKKYSISNFTMSCDQ